MFMNDPKKSPFAELSFSEQQEQWRIFRARNLDFQRVPSPEPPRPQPAAAPAEKRIPSAPVFRPEPPRHANLDRVRSRLNAAARRTGAFQTVTSRE